MVDDWFLNICKRHTVSTQLIQKDFTAPEAAYKQKTPLSPSLWDSNPSFPSTSELWCPNDRRSDDAVFICMQSDFPRFPYLCI